MTKEYRYIALNSVGRILLFAFAATTLIQSVVPMMTLVYAGDDSDGSNSETKIAQDVKQKQKCKVGNFGDPEDSASSTTFGFCNQQAQNNIAGGGRLGGVGPFG